MAAPLQLRQFQRIFRQFKKKSLCRAFSVTSSLSNKPSTEEKTTHFGFQTVTEEEKEKEGSISIKFLTSLSFEQKLFQGCTVIGSGSGARDWLQFTIWVASDHCCGMARPIILFHFIWLTYAGQDNLCCIY